MIMIAKSCNETRFRLFWDTLYIRFQKYYLICTSDLAQKKLHEQYFNGEFHSVIGDFCARIIPP